MAFLQMAFAWRKPPVVHSRCSGIYAGLMAPAVEGCGEAQLGDPMTPAAVAAANIESSRQRSFAGKLLF